MPDSNQHSVRHATLRQIADHVDEFFPASAIDLRQIADEIRGLEEQLEAALRALQHHGYGPGLCRCDECFALGSEYVDRLSGASSVPSTASRTYDTGSDPESGGSMSHEPLHRTWDSSRSPSQQTLSHKATDTSTSNPATNWSADPATSDAALAPDPASSLECEHDWDVMSVHHGPPGGSAETLICRKCGAERDPASERL